MPVIKQKNQRVGIFIDVQNLYHSAKNLYHARVNFREVIKARSHSDNLCGRLHMLSVLKRGGERVFEALAKLGIETREKELQTFYGGAKKVIGMLVLPLMHCALHPRWTPSLFVQGTAIFCRLLNNSKAWASKRRWWRFQRPLPQNFAKERMISSICAQTRPNTFPEINTFYYKPPSASFRLRVSSRCTYKYSLKLHYSARLASDAL